VVRRAWGPTPRLEPHFISTASNLALAKQSCEMHASCAVTGPPSLMLVVFLRLDRHSIAYVERLLVSIAGWVSTLGMPGKSQVNGTNAELLEEPRGRGQGGGDTTRHGCGPHNSIQLAHFLFSRSNWSHTSGLSHPFSLAESLSNSCFAPIIPVRLPRSLCFPAWQTSRVSGAEPSCRRLLFDLGLRCLAS
jgi:hypothetical protein